MNYNSIHSLVPLSIRLHNIDRKLIPDHDQRPPPLVGRSVGRSVGEPWVCRGGIAGAACVTGALWVRCGCAVGW